MNELVKRLVQGDKVACARLISIIESGRDAEYELLKEIYHSSTGACGISASSTCPFSRQNAPS